jgi:phosphoribosylanthranilate isomerase
MQTKLKICGITNLKDAERCRELGVDFLGLIFAESPRRIDIDTAALIARKMSAKIATIGVFDKYDINLISDVVRKVKLDYLQVYYYPNNGLIPNPPLPLISSVWVDGAAVKMPPYPCQYLLLDFKRVGSVDGLDTNEWNRINSKYDVFLAGGIDAENVAGILAYYKPYGIDAARGTESSPGIKDHRKLAEFVEKVRSC